MKFYFRSDVQSVTTPIHAHRVGADHSVNCNDPACAADLIRAGGRTDPGDPALLTEAEHNEIQQAQEVVRGAADRVEQALLALRERKAESPFVYEVEPDGRGAKVHLRGSAGIRPPVGSVASQAGDRPLQLDPGRGNGTPPARRPGFLRRILP